MTQRALNTEWRTKCTQLRWVQNNGISNPILNLFSKRGGAYLPLPWWKTLQDLKELYKIFKQLQRRCDLFSLLSSITVYMTFTIWYNTHVWGKAWWWGPSTSHILLLPFPTLFHPAPVTSYLAAQFLGISIFYGLWWHRCEMYITKSHTQPGSSCSPFDSLHNTCALNWHKWDFMTFDMTNVKELTFTTVSSK